MVWLQTLLVFVPYSCVALDVTLGDAAMNRYWLAAAVLGLSFVDFTSVVAATR